MSHVFPENRADDIYPLLEQLLECHLSDVPLPSLSSGSTVRLKQKLYINGCINKMNNVKHKIPFSLVKTASLIGSVVEADVRVDVSGCLISPAAGMVRTLKKWRFKDK